MTPIYKPTWMLNAIYNLTPEMLKQQHVKVVFTDLDNTLIAWNNPNGTAELKAWMTAMENAGIEIVVVSNNNANRVRVAVAPLGLPFVARALKPLPVGIHRALKHWQVQPNEVVMVGDQLMTDIIAANVSGVRSILVRPLVKTDAWNTKINRFIERFFMASLKRRYHKTYQEDLNG